ncbi:MAG: MoaD/ThiS family protein [Rhodobacteraceae bacterium]|nr:MoaD/ThiS family protein [Paracoccaceae bacterium]
MDTLENPHQIGHNSGNSTVSVETKLFNSMSLFAGPEGPVQILDFPAGTTIGDIIHHLNLPIDEIFLVLRNGRDVSTGLVGERVNTTTEVEDGDAIAFSGPVPYSFGYGAPVV